MGGERERQVGVVPIHQRAGDMAAWLQGMVRRGRRRRVELIRVLGRYRGKRRHFVHNPLTTFSVITKRSSGNIGSLDEALKHFYKIHKNL